MKRSYVIEMDDQELKVLVLAVSLVMEEWQEIIDKPEEQDKLGIEPHKLDTLRGMVVVAKRVLDKYSCLLPDKRTKEN